MNDWLVYVFSILLSRPIPNTTKQIGYNQETTQIYATPTPTAKYIIQENTSSPIENMLTHKVTDKPQENSQIPYLPVITPWAYRKERPFFWAYTRTWVLFDPTRLHGHKMLSFGQSSTKYLKTEIPQMLAIIHLQDQRYWYPYSINIHAETKHYTHAVGLKPVKSIKVGFCNEDTSLVVSTFTQH